MKISPKGIQAIKKEEGLVLEAYEDAGNPPTWTIGYGHTRTAVPGMKITKKRAEELLRSDLQATEAAINQYVKVPLTQPQYDALYSLVFNIGVGAFSKSTLLKKLNQGDYIGAADEFPKWRRSGNKILKGLVARRARERTLFLSGTNLEEETKLEANITPDPVEPPTTLSEPGVQATGTVAAGLGLSELTGSLEPLAAYSETIRMVFVALSVLAIGFVIWKKSR